MSSLFSLPIRLPPTSTLFPYTTLFRSAGVGNPFSIRQLQPGERVVDVGSGAGFDSFIAADQVGDRSEEHTSELQSRRDLVCRLLLEKKKSKLRTRARRRTLPLSRTILS